MMKMYRSLPLLMLALVLVSCGQRQNRNPTAPGDPSTPSTPTQQPPTIASIAPLSGSADGGVQVVITGTNFTNVTGILFGTTPAPFYTVDSDTAITVTASPALGTTAVPVFVTTSAGTSVSGNASTMFTGLPNALLDFTLDADSVTAGTTLRGTATVTFAAPAGGINLPLTWTSTPTRSTGVLIPLTMHVPAGSTSGSFPITTLFQSLTEQIRVSTDHGGQSKSATFTLHP